MTSPSYRATIVSLMAVFAAVSPASGDPILLEPDWDFEPDQETAFLGQAVSGAGDVNGDGYDDVLVGANSYTDDENNEGRVWLFYGTEAGLADTAAWFADGDQVFAEFGWAVAAAGDVNNDGFDDVIIGARFYSNGENREGMAFVYHGSGDGLPAEASWSADGGQPLALFGYSVAGAGDVNNDGYDDVIIGSFGYDVGDSTDAGRACLYLGSEDGLADTTAWVAYGDQTEAVFGVSVAGAGDVNNDGFDDIIVGASRYDNPEPDEGRAYLYFGSDSGPSGTADWTAEGDYDDAAFGICVASAGDVNGDLYDDIIVGAYRWDVVQVDEGKVFVYHGSEGGPSAVEDWWAVNEVHGAEFGFSVASAGDVDGNGYDDVIIGAVGFELFGTDNGGAFIYTGADSGLTAEPVCMATVEDSLAHFGHSVRAAGDVNDDGLSDVVVGALLYDHPEENEGRAFAFYGQTAAGVPVTEPARPSVLRIHPNPSTTRSHLVYSLESRANVVYTIYDLRGRKVAEVTRRGQEPGLHTLTWDGLNARGQRVSPGVYFGRLAVGRSTIPSTKIIIE